MSWVSETPSGLEFWKFNNTLLKDENYVAIVRETYTNTLRYYEHVSDKRLLWELIKMEIRNTTISYTKQKAKMSSDHAKDIRQQLEQLDEIICKDFFASDVNQVLQCYDSLKSELGLYMKIKENTLCSERSVAGWRTANAQLSSFSTWKKETITKRLLVNSVCRMNQRHVMKKRS